MSETSTVNFRMDSELKRKMESVSQERRIPFEINADPFYSASNIEYLTRVTSEIDSGAAPLFEHELHE